MRSRKSTAAEVEQVDGLPPAGVRSPPRTCVARSWLADTLAANVDEDGHQTMVDREAIDRGWVGNPELVTSLVLALVMVAGAAADRYRPIPAGRDWPRSTRLRERHHVDRNSRPNLLPSETCPQSFSGGTMGAMTQLARHIASDRAALLDVSDAEEYAAGVLPLDVYTRRAITRHLDEVPQPRGSVDPVAVYDAMREAGTALMGSFVWLADRATDEGAAARWWTAYAEVLATREQVDARDVETQRRVTREYLAREQAVRPMVGA